MKLTSWTLSRTLFSIVFVFYFTTTFANTIQGPLCTFERDSDYRNAAAAGVQHSITTAWNQSGTTFYSNNPNGYTFTCPIVFDYTKVTTGIYWYVNWHGTAACNLYVKDKRGAVVFNTQITPYKLKKPPAGTRPIHGFTGYPILVDHFYYVQCRKLDAGNFHIYWDYRG